MPARRLSRSFVGCRYLQAMVVLLAIVPSSFSAQLESEYRQQFNTCAIKQCSLHVTFQDNFNCLASKCTAKEITGKQISCKVFSTIMEDCLSSCESTSNTSLLACNQSCLAMECSSEMDSSSDSSFDWTILFISIGVVGGIIIVFGFLVKLAIRRKMAKLLQIKIAQEQLKSQNQLPLPSYMQQRGQQQVVLSTQDPLAAPSVGIQGIPCFDNIGQGDYENVLLGVDLDENCRKKQKKQSGKYNGRKPNNILRYMSQGENIVGTVIEEKTEGNGQQSDKTLPIDEVQINHITPNTLVAANKQIDSLISKTRQSPKKGSVEPAIFINQFTNNAKNQEEGIRQFSEVEKINNVNEPALNKNDQLRIDVRDHKRKSYISQYSNRNSGTSLSNFFGNKNSNRQIAQKTSVYSRGETYLSFDFRDDMIFSKGATSRKEILFSQNNLEDQKVPQKKRLTMMQLPSVVQAGNQSSKPEIESFKQRRRKSLDGISTQKGSLNL